MALINNNIVDIESDLKLIVEVNDFDGNPISDYDFTVEVFTKKNGNKFLYNKNDLSFVNNSSFILPLSNMQELGIGILYLKINILSEDSSFKDNIRKDILRYNTGIYLVNPE